MADDDRPDPEFDAMTSRLLRREALRRAAEEMNTTSGPGLEGVLARISAEVTAEAAASKTEAAATKPSSGANKTFPAANTTFPAARERSPRGGR
jgi:hypothetical protein